MSYRSEVPTSAGRISIHVIQNAHSGGEAWTTRQGAQSVGPGYHISHSLPQSPPATPRVEEIPDAPAKLASIASPPVAAHREASPGRHLPKTVQSSRHTTSVSVDQKHAVTQKQAKTTSSATKSSNKEPQAIQKSLYSDGASAASPRDQIARAQAEAIETLSTKTRAWVASQQSAISATGNVDRGTKISVDKGSSKPSASLHDGIVNEGVAPKSEGSIRRIAREEVERYREAERKLETHPSPFAYGSSGSSPLQVFVSNLHGPYHYNDSIPTRTTGSVNLATQGSVKNTTSGHRSSKSSQKTPSVPDSTSSTKQHTSLEVRTGTSSKEKQIYDQSTAPSKRSEPVSQLTGSKQASKVPQYNHSSAKSLEARSNNDTYEITQSMLRHKESFETDFTVHPDSSISQQPPFGFVEQRRAFRWNSEELPPSLPFPRVETIKAESRKPSSHASPKIASPSASVTVTGPEQSALIVPKLASQPPASVESKDKDSRSSQNTKYVDVPVPPRRPHAPSKADRVAEDCWTFEEQINPDRVRVVRERLIRGRVPSLERFASEHSSPKPRVKRYEIVDEVRTLPEERGRARKREGDEAPKERLRSILRSSSNSRSGDRQTRSSSFSRRVTFSEAIDVTLVSPPPSSSQIDDEYQEVSSRKSGRSRKKEKSRKRDSRRHHVDAEDDETYYYQRTRRPAKEELDRSAQIPDPKPINRRRALARALNESPSRERGYHMLEDADVDEWREPRSKSFAENDHIIEDDSSVRHNHPNLASTSDGNRIPIVMSSGLSKISSKATASTRRHEGAERTYEHHPPPPSHHRQVSNIPAPAALPYYAEQQALPPPPLPTAEFEPPGRRASRYAPSRSARSPSDFYQSARSAPVSGSYGPGPNAPWPPEGRIVREGVDEHGHWYEVETVEQGNKYGGRRHSDYRGEQSQSARSGGTRQGDRWDTGVDELGRGGRNGRGYDRR